MKRLLHMGSVALVLCLVLGGCGQKEASSGDTGPVVAERPETISSDEVQFATPADDDPAALITTSMGPVLAVLYPQYAPMAVENFTGLAQQGYFNGLPFHRIISGFLVQTGDATGTGTGGNTIWNNTPYPTEICDALHHYSGALAIAHPTDDSAQNMSQFYIVQTPTDSVSDDYAATLTAAGVRSSVIDTYKAAGGAPYLDNLCTVFGQVVQGMRVVDIIAQTPCSEAGKPLTDVLVSTVSCGTYAEQKALYDAAMASPGTTSDAEAPTA